MVKIDDKEKKKFKFPPIGQRMIRSMIGVALCFVVYFLRGQRGIPFYSALAVLQCIQPYQANSLKMAKQRTTGTFVGAFWGLVILLIELYALPGFVKESMIGYLIITVGTGFVLYSTVLLNKKNASYFSCVVFLSITVMHMTDASPFIFVLNRVADTLIGIAVAVVVNTIHFPRTKHTEILFVSGIDEALLNTDQMITPYSKVELNRLIDEGAKFTVSTMRTPASIMDSLSEIHFNIPIITMDGAALFDIEKNSYLLSYTIPNDSARKILDFISEYHMHCFINVIIDDLLIIYYGDALNTAEQDVLHKLRRSPYRNYVKRELPENEDVSYLMLLDTSEQIDKLYRGMELGGYTEAYKVLKYPSREYPGYDYMKIYSRDATRANMLGNLKDMLHVDQSVTFGSIQGEADVWIENSDENQVVKELKKRFQPIGFTHKEICE